MSQRKPTKKLTAKQERFCREYVIDCNGTQAAIRAGYSKWTANEQSSRLLAKGHIKARVVELSERVAGKVELTAEKVLGDIERVRGKAEDKGDWRSALKAGELQGRFLALFTDRVEQTGNIEVHFEVKRGAVKEGVSGDANPG